MLAKKDLNIKNNIYVKILDEDIDVWKPLKAIKICDDIYKIVEKDEEDNLQFNKGDIVRTKKKIFSGGSEGYVAYEKIDNQLSANYEDKEKQNG